MEPEAALGPPPGAAASLVWALRILLPVLLFALWYRLQAPAGGGKFCHHRDAVLAARRMGAADEPPECLLGLRLVDEATAQRLLGAPPPRAGGSGPAGRRDARAPRQRGQTERGRRSGELSDLGDPADAGEPAATAAAAAAAAAAAPGAEGLARLGPEELARHTALLNFVALGSGRPLRRSFLHDGEHPPPPPPARPAQAAGEAAAAAANAEAQALLRGLLNSKAGMRSAEVPRLLHRQLQDLQAPAEAATFALLVEASAGAGDLQMASDLLMKMEAAGHCAGSELLDMVMDLYAEGGARGARA